MNAIKTVVVGFGASARIFHAPLLAHNPAFSIAGFVERNDIKGQNAYPGTKSWKDLPAALSESKADLVVICTPNDTHVELSEIALNAGAHVLVEKPFTAYAHQADSLIAHAKSRKRLLTVFQSRRLDGDFLTIRDVLKSGVLGRVVSFESRYERWSPGIRPKPWKEAGAVGSTILDDLASHLIDQAIQLFGRPAGVYCRLAHQREGAKSDDAFSIDLYYPEKKDAPSAVQVRLVAGMMTRQLGPRFSVQGSKGAFRVFGMDPQEEHLSKGIAPTAVGYGEYPFAKWGELDSAVTPQELSKAGSGLSFWNERQQKLNPAQLDESFSQALRIETQPGNYPAFYQNLAEAIQTNDPQRLFVQPEESAFVIRVIEACRKSSTEGRTILL